jgi:hypothetical protein
MITSASLSGCLGAEARRRAVTSGTLVAAVVGTVLAAVVGAAAGASAADSVESELDSALDSGPGIGPAIRLSWVIARQFLQVACEDIHEVRSRV